MYSVTGTTAANQHRLQGTTTTNADHGSPLPRTFTVNGSHLPSYYSSYYSSYSSRFPAGAQQQQDEEPLDLSVLRITHHIQELSPVSFVAWNGHRTPQECVRPPPGRAGSSIGDSLALQGSGPFTSGSLIGFPRRLDSTPCLSSRPPLGSVQIGSVPYLCGLVIPFPVTETAPNPAVASNPVGAPSPVAARNPVAATCPAAATNPVAAPNPGAATNLLAAPNIAAAPSPAAAANPVVASNPVASRTPTTGSRAVADVTDAAAAGAILPTLPAAAVVHAAAVELTNSEFQPCQYELLDDAGSAFRPLKFDQQYDAQNRRPDVTPARAEKNGGEEHLEVPLEKGVVVLQGKKVVAPRGREAVAFQGKEVVSRLGRRRKLEKPRRIAQKFDPKFRGVSFKIGTTLNEKNETSLHISSSFKLDKIKKSKRLASRPPAATATTSSPARSNLSDSELLHSSINSTSTICSNCSGSRLAGNNGSGGTDGNCCSSAAGADRNRVCSSCCASSSGFESRSGGWDGVGGGCGGMGGDGGGFFDLTELGDFRDWMTPSSSFLIGKQCASCGAYKTPMWRDAEDGTPLCNACGIRYKKYRVRCGRCWRVPKKDTKWTWTCASCGHRLCTSAVVKHRIW